MKLISDAICMRTGGDTSWGPSPRRRRPGSHPQRVNNKFDLTSVIPNEPSPVPSRYQDSTTTLRHSVRITTQTRSKTNLPQGRTRDLSPTRAREYEGEVTARRDPSRAFPQKVRKSASTQHPLDVIFTFLVWANIQGRGASTV